jgi:hypothetical protein
MEVVKGGGGGAGGRIKLFYKTALTGSPTYNVGGGSGGTGTGGAPSGGTGGTGTYYTSNGSDFNLVPNVIASYPSNGTNYYPQKGSATKVPPYYTCTTTDTPGYSDGSDLLKNVTFYLWNSTGSLLYSNTASISGLTNSTNFYYTFDYTNYNQNYKWSCSVCDNKSECFNYPTNQTFNITQPSYNWLTMLIYDLLTTSPINPNLWATSTTGQGNVSIGSLIAMANTTFSASPATAEANATNLPNNIYINNVTFPVQLICVNGGTGTGTAELDAFGTAIKTLTCATPSSSFSDDSVWTLQQNYTAGSGKFDVYNDGVWQQQITGTNNLLRIYASAPAALLVTTYSTATINNVTYSLNNNFMNITLTSPANGSTITNPYFNFTASTNVSLNILSNASIYLDNTNQMTLPLNGTNASLLFPIVSMGIGNHQWYVKVCDNANNCKNSETRYFYNSYFLTVNTSYVASVYETDSQTYNTTVRFDTSAQPNSYAYLVYNGVTYPTQATKTTNGSDVTFSSTIDVPTSLGTKQFYFKIYLDPINDPLNIQTSTLTNQTVNAISLAFCSGGTKFINMNYLDEITNNPVNLSVSGSSWTYWLGSGTTSETYFFSTGTQNTTHSFCFTPAYETVYTSVNYQYGISGTYPIRTYQTAPLIPQYLTLTNTTLNNNLYTIAATDSSPITFQISDSTSANVIQGATVTITKNIGGVTTQIFNGYTDSAGTVSIWLSTVTPYTITATKTGCGSNTATITPVGSYNMQLNCAGNLTKYNSQINGVSYRRTPADGATSNQGTITFEYYVESIISPMTAAKFVIVDGQGNILATNETLVSSGYSFCTNSSCDLTLIYTTACGDNIKGRYYVNMGNVSNNTYILLEGDALWRYVCINENNSQLAFTKFMDHFNEFFYQWSAGGAGGTTCNIYSDATSCNAATYCKWVNYTGYQSQIELCTLKDNYNEAEFSRVVFIFFGLVIVLFIIGKTTGYEMTNPGSFVMFMTGAIIVLSFGGMFRFVGATPWPFFDQWIYALICLAISVGYNISISRRYTA